MGATRTLLLLCKYNSFQLRLHFDALTFFPGTFPVMACTWLCLLVQLSIAIFTPGSVGSAFRQRKKNMRISRSVLNFIKQADDEAGRNLFKRKESRNSHTSFPEAKRTSNPDVRGPFGKTSGETFRVLMERANAVFSPVRSNNATDRAI